MKFYGSHSKLLAGVVLPITDGLTSFNWFGEIYWIPSFLWLSNIQHAIKPMRQYILQLGNYHQYPSSLHPIVNKLTKDEKRLQAMEHKDNSFPSSAPNQSWIPNLYQIMGPQRQRYRIWKYIDINIRWTTKYIIIIIMLAQDTGADQVIKQKYHHQFEAYCGDTPC